MDWCAVAGQRMAALPQPVRRLLGCPPGELLAWLRERHGLRLELRVTGQREDTMRSEEATALRCRPETKALRRCVALQRDGTVYIEAESVIRLDTLHPALQTVLAAGEQPLGAALARHGRIRAGAIEVATLQHAQARPLWARRAVLHVPGAAQLLLTEVFLPPLWRLIGAHGDGQTCAAGDGILTGNHAEEE